MSRDGRRTEALTMTRLDNPNVSLTIVFKDHGWPDLMSDHSSNTLRRRVPPLCAVGIKNSQRNA